MDLLRVPRFPYQKRFHTKEHLNLATVIHLFLRSFESYRSSHSEVFQGKGVIKICCKFTGEHPCRRVISLKLLATLSKSHFGMGVLL